jgi:hypothetical protein
MLLVSVMLVGVVMGRKPRLEFNGVNIERPWGWFLVKKER